MKRKRIARLTAFLAASLAGGTVFGTCEARIHDSFINGTRLFVANLLDPSNFDVTLE